MKTGETEMFFEWVFVLWPCAHCGWYEYNEGTTGNWRRKAVVLKLDRVNFCIGLVRFYKGPCRRLYRQKNFAV